MKLFSLLLIKNKKLFPLFFLIILSLVFFYKTFVFGLLPFPADVLVSEYKPWSTYSYLGYNPGSYPSKKQYFDTLRQIYPWRTIVNNSWKSGNIPLWNPYNFSGSPLLANVQSQVFYPLTISYFFLSQSISWSFLVVLQPLLASLFMYLYLKKINLSTLPSLLGSISFAYSVYMTSFLEYNTIGHVIIWLPLLLFSIEKLIDKISVFYSLIFSFGIATTIFAGHLQLAAGVILLSCIYWFLRIITTSTKKRGKLALFISALLLTLTGVGIASIQLIPTAELLYYSARSNLDITDLVNRLLIQPKELLLLFIPDLFGNPASGNYLLAGSYPAKALFTGISTIVLSISFILSKKSDIIPKFYTFSLLFLFIFLTSNPLSKLFYQLSLPIVSSSNPTNYIFLISFSISVLASFGLENFQKNTLQRPNRGLIFLLLLLTVIWSLHLSGKVVMNKNMLFLGTGFFLSSVSLFAARSLLKINTQIISMFFIILTTIQLLYLFLKFNPFVPKELIYPKTHIETFLRSQTGTYRHWGYGTAAIEANFSSQLGTFSPEGYDPLYPKAYGSLLHSSNNGNFLRNFTALTRSDATISPGFGEKNFSENVYRKQLLNFLGVKYILNRTENNTTEETFPPNEYAPIYKENNWVILENKKVLPRVFMTLPYVKDITDESFEDVFYNLTFQTEDELISDKNVLPINPNGATAEIVKYTTGNVQIKTKAQEELLLVLTDTFFPGWVVKLDGENKDINKVLYTFKGVLVPEGEHTIAFTYTPKSFYTGATISTGSIIFLLFGLFIMKIREKRYKIA